MRNRHSGKRSRTAEGHLAVGVIDDAVEDAPGEVQAQDLLLIKAEVPGQGTLRRRVSCPLSTPGSGRLLIGQALVFRHDGVDSDDVDDIFVTRWPPRVREALEPFRPVGPGALRARAWKFLARSSAVATVGGILLTMVMLVGVVFTGGELFAGLPSWFRPGVALAGSAGAAVLGAFAFAVCEARVGKAASRPQAGLSTAGRG